MSMPMDLPQVDFYLLDDDNNLVTKTTRDIFAGKRTVLFALPGAFTPTCTEQQLPGFEAVYDQIVEMGVDQIICTSVNDAFVMKAWGEKLGIKNVMLLPDGNGALCMGMKANISKENKGFGMRSWRLAMILNENVKIEWTGVEEGIRPLATDDPYEASTPQRVIGALLTLEAEKNASVEAEPVGFGK